MRDGERAAVARAQTVIDHIETSDAGAFLELVDPPEVRPVEGADLWVVGIRCLFRVQAERFLASPTIRGAHEPLLLIEEVLDLDGNVVVYNYDVVVPEFDEHFGFHLHEHKAGKGPEPHRQGFGVPSGHEPYQVVDLERDGVLWDLVTAAIAIDFEHRVGVDARARS